MYEKCMKIDVKKLNALKRYGFQYFKFFKVLFFLKHLCVPEICTEAIYFRNLLHEICGAAYTLNF